MLLALELRETVCRRFLRVKPLFLAGLCLSLLGCASTDMMVNDQRQQPLRGVGHAPLKAQPGSSAAQKQIMAMRAAKNAAMRELAEKIYGADVWASTSVVRGGVYSDTNRNSVEGLVRGARVVSIKAVKNDVYEAIVEVDPADVDAMRSITRKTFH
jgi:hypothetical protein